MLGRLIASFSISVNESTQIQLLIPLYGLNLNQPTISIFGMLSFVSLDRAYEDSAAVAFYCREAKQQQCQSLILVFEVLNINIKRLIELKC